MKDRKKKKEKRPRRRVPASFSDAERGLWDILRDRRVAGARFMRRFAIGRLVVDFVCRERRLAVMIDADQRADARPELSLNARGYRLLRLHGEDILRHPARVRAAVALQLDRSDPDGHNE